MQAFKKKQKTFLRLKGVYTMRYHVAALLFLLLGFVPLTASATTTTAETASATPGKNSLAVSAPYTGDSNTNNSLLIEWGLNGVDFSLGSQNLPHSASPYTHQITGLTNGTGYQLRLTFQDTDGGSNLIQTLTDLTPYDPIVHSSLSTESTKWAAEGGWGIPSGKYGEFTCQTCHTSGSSNIKHTKETITAPNGTDQFPIQAAAGSVVFSSAEDGSSDFGNDSGGHATSSKICEACHSLTDYHRYNTTGQSELGHYNNNDCLRCHPHSDGFAHGGSGTNCIECHGHDAGTNYDPDMTAPYSAGSSASQGAGTVQSHSTHTETTGDDLIGPGIYCDSCHDITNFPYFKSGTDSNSDGKYTLDETDVCDTCHSSGGTYDGVDDATIGAKNNWDAGVYLAGALQTGKEKWCAGCHDDSASVIDSVTAPNVIGDETEITAYGTGWGYYKTGHGLPSGAYPASQTAAANTGCDGCHDLTTSHIDGDYRTYANGSDNYQAGYRLKSGMDIPRTDNDADSNPLASDFSLCFDCHSSDPYLVSSNYTTEFRDATTLNQHWYHLQAPPTGAFAGGNWWDSDWDGTGDSKFSCTACHNVHGSPSARMIRHGELISTPGTTDKVPALDFEYSPSGTYPVLADSTGGEISGISPGGGSVSNTGVCSMCHSNNVAYVRTPNDMAPTIEGVYGQVGSADLLVVFSEAVYTTTGSTGALTSADFTLNDSDDSRTINAVSHNAGDKVATLTLSAALDGSDDLNSDTLSAADGASIYDDADQAMVVTPVTITGDSTAPTISSLSPTNSATDVSIYSDLSMTLEDTGSGVDLSTFSIVLSGSRGYSKTYTESDVTVVSASGTTASYVVTVDPDLDFTHDETITVTVNVSDYVGNALTPPTWSFTTLTGGGPFSATLYPSGVASAGVFSNNGGDWADIFDSNDGDTSYAYGCCSASGATFTVDMDDPTGLDNASIQSLTVYVRARYNVQGGSNPPGDVGDLDIGYKTGTSTVWRGTFTTTSADQEYDLVASTTYTTDSDGGALDLTDINNLQVSVKREQDGSTPGLLVTEIYVEVGYGVQEGDATDPTIADLSPANSGTEVLANSNLTFTLADTGGGIDWSTLQVQLSGDKGYSKTYTDLDTTVITKTGNPASYAVTVNPDVDFGGEEVITVTVNVDDAAGNSLTPPTWSFTTAAAATPLTVTLHPSGAASSGSYTANGGGWADILDSNDGLTSYVNICCTAMGAKFWVDLDDPVGLDSATIQSLTFHVRAMYRNVGGGNPSGTIGNLDIGYRTDGATAVWKGSTTTTYSDLTFELISSTTYTTDSTGGALDLTDINNLQIAASRLHSGGGYNLHVTEVYAEITYLP